MRTVNPIDFSNFLILYFNEQEIRVTNLVLQKLLYYIQAWHLVHFNGEPLFEDEAQAWVHGPVYSSVYHHFKNKGSEELSFDGDLEEEKKGLGLCQAQFDLIESVVLKYGFMPASKLVYLTHRELPWNQARKGLGLFDYSSQVISHESMRAYYSKRLAANHG